MATELMQELELDKRVQKALIANEFLFRKIPTATDPELQKKIKQLYTDALETYKKTLPSAQERIIRGINSDFANTFTSEELQYLITLSKYPPSKKLRNFLNSQSFDDSMISAFQDAKKMSDKLKKDVSELQLKSKNTLEPKK